jgi:hypothetical protein
MLELDCERSSQQQQIKGLSFFPAHRLILCGSLVTGRRIDSDSVFWMFIPVHRVRMLSVDRRANHRKRDKSESHAGLSHLDEIFSRVIKGVLLIRRGAG